MLVWTYGNNEHTPGPGFGLSAWEHAGPKYIWVRDIRPLIDGVPLTPFTRAAMAGDMASSLTHYGASGLQFINADYTLTLSRLPRGALPRAGRSDALQPRRRRDGRRHHRRSSTARSAAPSPPRWPIRASPRRTPSAA